MIDAVTHHWLEMLSRYGWVMLVPLLEWFRPSRRQQIFRKGLLNDLIHAFQPLSFHPFVVSGLAVSLTFFDITPMQGGLSNLPWHINLIAIILIFESTFYFFHRASHKIPILWQFHRVHHSSVILDSNSTTRSHIVDKAYFSSPYVLLIILLKPDPEVLFLYTVFQSFWDRYGHSNVNGPFFTGRFIASPHFHGWHHSTIPEARDRNFSRDFVFMDYLFNTVYYPDKIIPHSFGEPHYSNNILVQHWLPFFHIYEHARDKGFATLFLPYPNNKAKNRIESNHASITPSGSPLPIFDFFRLLAALLVVIVHFRFFFGQEIIPDIYASSALSWFFILSGFILAYRYPQIVNINETKKFFQHRVTRIFPIYFLGIAISATLLFAIYDPNNFNTLSPLGLLHFITYDLKQSLSYAQIQSAIVESLFFIQLYNTNESIKFLINPPLWSIACEAVFYLAFPLIIMLIRPSFSLTRLLFLLIACLGLQAWLISFFTPSDIVVDWYNSNGSIYTNPLVRIPEFILGIILCRLFYKTNSNAFSSSRQHIWAGLLVLQIILYPIWVSYRAILPFEFALYYFLVPINALLIFSLAKINWQPSALYCKRATLLGNLSYPIYALHWPILGILNQYKVGHSLLIDYKPIFYLSVLCLIIGISLFVLTLFEIPLRRLLRKKFIDKRQGNLT